MLPSLLSDSEFSEPDSTALAKTDYLSYWDMFLIIYFRVSSVSYAFFNVFPYWLGVQDGFEKFYEYNDWEKDEFIEILPLICLGMSIPLILNNIKKYGELAFNDQRERIRKGATPQEDREEAIENNYSCKNLFFTFCTWNAIILKTAAASMSCASNIIKWGGDEGDALWTSITLLFFLNLGANYLFFYSQEKNKNFWDDFFTLPGNLKKVDSEKKTLFDSKDRNFPAISDAEEIEQPLSSNAAPITNVAAQSMPSLTPKQCFEYLWFCLYCTGFGGAAFVYPFTNPFPYILGVHDGVERFYKYQNKEPDIGVDIIFYWEIGASIALALNTFGQYWPMAKNKFREFKNSQKQSSKSNETQKCDIKVVLATIATVIFFHAAPNLLKGVASSLSFSNNIIKWGGKEKPAFISGEIFIVFNCLASYMFFTNKKKPKKKQESLKGFICNFFGRSLRGQIKTEDMVEFSSQVSASDASIQSDFSQSKKSKNSKYLKNQEGDLRGEDQIPITYSTFQHK